MTEKNSFHGIILIDKPVGCTSHDVVSQARKIFNTSAVGHSGTLDPLASGLLILLLGEATKISNYILSGNKGYEVKVRLGMETDTLDREGKILKETPCDLSKTEIEEALLKMTGNLDLLVPVYSAVKIDGKKLHREARAGHDVVAPMRKMNFYGVKAIEIAPNWLTVDLRCEKGSYVRAWAAELGQKLGVGAMVDELRRVWSEPYFIDQAVSLSEFKERPWSEIPAAIPLGEALPHWPSVVVEGKDKTLLVNGQISYGLKGRLKPYYKNLSGTGIKAVAPGRKSLLALLTPTPLEGDFTIARVFNSPANQ